jgi:transketolase
MLVIPAIIFPNSGGRFQFSQDECQQIAEGCRRPLGRFQPAFPSPAGGMKLDCVPEMRKTFGDDTLFLIGGALLEQGPDLEEDARLFAHCAGRDRPYCAAEELQKSKSFNDTIPRKAHTTVMIMKNKAKVAPHTSTPSVAEIEQVANAVRRRVLEYTLKNNGGYLSQACSSAETLATLYLKSLRLGPSVSPPIPPPFHGSPGPGIATITGEGYNGDNTSPHLDRLIFSPVHYALPLYSLLVEIGRLDVKAFESYNKDGSTVELIGAEHSPGHAVTAGSLGQALSQAAGIAYARNLKHHTGRVFVYMSDGEMQEGQTWEAVQAMVFLHIELTAVVDVNGQQCDGKMESVCDVGSLGNKLRAFGAVVREVDGHNVHAIDEALDRDNQSGPTFVLCYTDPCRGFPLLREMAPKLHYIRFKNPAEKLKWENVLAQMESPRTFHCMNNASKAPHQNDKPIAAQSKLNAPTSTTRLEQCSVLRDLETVVRPHQRRLLEWMKTNPDAVVLTADLTSSCEADLVRDNLPNQYLSMGMAEQNMMSFAGGLAREGLR